ncbi:MAG: hypothetical protein EOP84_35785 [Verrucomicrobiaceae bacterium]|nr:MAG: hypothetical protein EOP84_35785 [Verrucomicrobiaceae bacterium]
METSDVTKPEICPHCGRQRVWALWRKCECGYDFGPEVPAGYSAEPQKHESPPKEISHSGRCAILVASWTAWCAIWALVSFYGYGFMGPLGLCFYYLGAYSEGYRVGVPRWLKFAAWGAGGLFVLNLALLIWFDIRGQPEKLALAPPFHRFVHQVLPLVGIPPLAVAGYYIFLIITRRVTQAEPEKP